MKYYVIICASIFLACSCSKKNDIVAPLKDYRVQMLEYFSNKILPGLRMDVYRRKMDILTGQPEFYFSMVTTDPAGEVILPQGYTYRFVPYADTLWNPDASTDFIFYDTATLKKIYFFPFTELRLHPIPNDSLNFSVEATFQDTLHRGLPIIPGDYYFNTILTETPSFNIITGIDNTVKLHTTLKDGTPKELIYKIHPTDHQPIHIDLPF